MQKRWAKVATALWIAVVLAVGVVTVAVRGGEPSLDQLLDRVDRFSREAKTFRFEAKGESVVVTGDAERGRRVSQRFTMEGSEGPSERRLLIARDDVVSEVIQVRTRAVFRMAEREAQLSRQKWQALSDSYDPSEPYLTQGVRRFEIRAFTGDIRSYALHPRIVRRDEGLPVIHFDVNPEVADDDVVRSLSTTGELTVERDGTPRRMVINGRNSIPGGAADLILETTADYRFSDWGKPLDFTVPSEADIDITPEIEEEEVAAFRIVPVYQPRGIPAGWILEYADVLDEYETEEECPEVELDYTDPDDPDQGYLWLYQLEASCADLVMPRDAEPFKAGPYQGWIIVDEDEGNSAQIVVDKTVVQADTDLSPASLSRILGDLVPLDLSQTPSPIPGLS